MESRFPRRKKNNIINAPCQRLDIHGVGAAFYIRIDSFEYEDKNNRKIVVLTNTTIDYYTLDIYIYVLNLHNIYIYI